MPIVSPANLGKQITVVGRAESSKIGARLAGDQFVLWIDGLSSWPIGYYSVGKQGVRIRATGILAEDNDLPVFIQREGDLPVQGIPVPEGTDLKKASHRFVLKKATWEVINE
jgi:hypothetical protein